MGPHPEQSSSRAAPTSSPPQGSGVSVNRAETVLLAPSVLSLGQSGTLAGAGRALCSFRARSIGLVGPGRAWSCPPQLC